MESVRTRIHLQTHLNGHALSSLIDSGSTEDVISRKTTLALKLPVEKLLRPRKVTSYDGNSKAYVTHRTLPLPFKVAGRMIKRSFLVAKMEQELILGIKWLYDENPQIDWRTKRIEFVTPGERTRSTKGLWISWQNSSIAEVKKGDLILVGNHY